jgi:hypothetical protein
MNEIIYNFDLTESQIVAIKAALVYSGLAFCKNREVFKLLCEAVNTPGDTELLARYE